MFIVTDGSEVGQFFRFETEAYLDASIFVSCSNPDHETGTSYLRFVAQG